MLKGKVHMNAQEGKEECNFAAVPKYMTCGFKNIFGMETDEIIATALAMITGRYHDKADYLQTFEYRRKDGRNTRFWCIHDGGHITFLLPEEY